MNAAFQPKPSRVAGFRTQVLLSMMLVVSAVTVVALYFAERNLAADVEEDLRRDFEGKLAALQAAQEVRQGALGQRQRSVPRNARIRASLEEYPDQLYPNGDTELRDLMPRGAELLERREDPMRAEFYRFLDPSGGVIPVPREGNFGALLPEESAQLALAGAPTRRHTGYFWKRNADGSENIFEIIATPIISTDNAEVIATLVLGFKPFELAGSPAATGLKSGIWLNGRLDLPEGKASVALTDAVTRAVSAVGTPERPVAIELDRTPHLLFCKRLNPGSLYPPAYEACVFPLTELRVRQRQLRWKILGAGTLLLLGGLGVSHFAAGRLSRPVEKMAVDSEEQRAQRERAETALELTHEELQRSARFSADASHQLKTPVSVLRAGLEELLAREHLSSDECDQISALIHQTYRLSSLIEDLLLLSRMDAGRLKMEFSRVNLSELIEAGLDDLGALPDQRELRVETNFPPDLHILGEKRYTTIILQNLLENARKYNHPGGRIRIAAAE
ncbi:MAG: HAMP domain-containing sensor histidine kinase, partial [Opitutaceae bacterium]